MIRTPGQAIDIAKCFMETKYPKAIAGFCAGSIIRGEGTESSDIDLVVIFAKVENAWRESFVSEDWPIEVFAHDPSTLKYFYEKLDIPSGRPSLPQMLNEGVQVWGDESEGQKLKTHAADLLGKGPPPLNAQDIQTRLYGIFDLLEDLRAPKSRPEMVAIGTRLYAQMGDFYLRSQNQWSGEGKQLLRAIRRFDRDWYEQFVGAFETLFAKKNHSEVTALAQELAASHGGFQFVGYRRDAPADWRV